MPYYQAPNYIFMYVRAVGRKTIVALRRTASDSADDATELWNAVLLVVGAMIFAENSVHHLSYLGNGTQTARTG